MTTLDVKENRRARKYSPGEMTRRVLWTFAQPLFRFSPRPCFGWRRFLLRCFGATIGRSVHIYPSATIYFPWNLQAGDESAIGEQAFIYDLASRAPLRGNARSYEAGFSLAAFADCHWLGGVDLCRCLRRAGGHSRGRGNCGCKSSGNEGRKASKHRCRKSRTRK